MYWNNQSRTSDKGWSSGLGGSGEVPTTPPRKNLSCYEPFTKTLVNAVMNLRVP